jgi:hypothetical protein
VQRTPIIAMPAKTAAAVHGKLHGLLVVFLQAHALLSVW